MKNKRAMNRLIDFFLIVIVLIVIIAIVYLIFFNKTSDPPQLPEEETPLNYNTNNGSDVETPAINITPRVSDSSSGSSSSGNSGSGESETGEDNNDVNLIVNETGWGKRDLGEVGTVSDESTPNLPSLKFSFQKIIDFFKGLFD